MSLRNHMRIHGQKRYMCDLCGKAFRLARYLRNHQRIHDDGPNRFDCPSCCKSYRTMLELAQHRCTAAASNQVGLSFFFPQFRMLCFPTCDPVFESDPGSVFLSPACLRCLPAPAHLLQMNTLLSGLLTSSSFDSGVLGACVTSTTCRAGWGLTAPFLDRLSLY